MHRTPSKSIKRLLCLDLLSCLELAVQSIGSKLPYIAGSMCLMVVKYVDNIVSIDVFLYGKMFVP